ncbi:MAG: ISNCY family transposase, partial [bacterium]|nr:ISNCY family transposase [bacterium]
LKQALNEHGPVGLAHGNRGRKASHAVADKIVEEVERLYKTTYKGFNFSHFHEKLIEPEGFELSLSSVRRILKSAGYASPRTRRAPKHRSRREPRSCEGAMLQIDGSPHDWLEGRGPRMCLVGGIDDATSKVVGGVFREYEDAHGYFLLMRGIVSKYGIPESVYHDHHGIFERDAREQETLIEQLEGEREPTQFGRLMQELGVRQIAANSPQAKGRIERLWATFQDRLISELRLANACTLEEANEVLQRVIVEHNRRFCRKAGDPKSVWRKLGASVDWDSVFCFKYKRSVAKDNTISLFNTVLQIAPGPGARSYAGCLVQAQHRFDGTLRVYYQGQCVAKTNPPLTAPGPIRVRAINGQYAEECPWTAPKPQPSRQETDSLVVEVKPRTVRKPAPDHPWRKPAVTKSLTD